MPRLYWKACAYASGVARPPSTPKNAPLMAAVPNAEPICRVDVTTPEASPAFCGTTSASTVRMIDGSSKPWPTPAHTSPQ